MICRIENFACFVINQLTGLEEVSVDFGICAPPAWPGHFFKLSIFADEVHDIITPFFSVSLLENVDASSTE